MMARATGKAASLTTLVIGKIEIPIGLFSTVDKPGKLAEFTTAGPHGGRLMARSVARPVPVEETQEIPEVPVRSDPLAEWQKFAAEAEDDARRRGMAASEVEGEYGRELVEEGTGAIVKPGQERRGVRLEDGSFVDCTRRLAEIEQETKLERAEVISFVDVTRIPRARVKGAYFIGTDDEQAPHALRIIFEGLKRKRRGAVVKLTKRSRQSLGVIGWLGETLMLYELVWREDFREAPARARRIAQAHVSEREVGMFCELIDALSAGVESLDELRDDALALREELRDRAVAGEHVEEPADEIVNAEVVEPQDEILEQLAASLAAVGS